MWQLTSLCTKQERTFCDRHLRTEAPPSLTTGPVRLGISGAAQSRGRGCRVNTTTFLPGTPCRSCPLGERQPPPPEAVVRGACRRARLAPKESSTCSRRSASRRARARARWLTFLPTRPSTRPVRARPHCLCPVGTPAAAGLQNSARAGHEERDFPTPPHVLRTRKPSLDARPNGSPKLSLVPDGPP